MLPLQPAFQLQKGSATSSSPGTLPPSALYPKATKWDLSSVILPPNEVLFADLDPFSRDGALIFDELDPQESRWQVRPSLA